IVDQRQLVGANSRDMAVERVVAGVDFGAGEPAAVGAEVRIEHLLRRLDPVDLPRGFSPEALGIGERAGVDLAIPAFVVNVHGLAPSVVPQVQKDLNAAVHPAMIGIKPGAFSYASLSRVRAAFQA